jgi:hypothetical protein
MLLKNYVLFSEEKIKVSRIKVEKILKNHVLKCPKDDFRQSLKKQLKNEIHDKRPLDVTGYNFAFINACLAFVILIMVSIHFFNPAGIIPELTHVESTYAVDSREEAELFEELTGIFDSREIETYRFRTKFEPEPDPVNQIDLIRELLEEVRV